MSTRPDVHSGQGLEAYIEGMARSKGDKARILNHVKAGRLLELGCGSGAVLELLHQAFPQSPLVGIDLSAKLLGVAARALGDAATLYRHDLFLLAQNPTLLPEAPFSSVVLSSTLHELATYALEHPQSFAAAHPPTHQAALQVLTLAANLLQDQGVLVVRDGVQPPLQTLQVRFVRPETEELFWRFADDFRPFKIEFAVKGNRYTLPSTHFYEFATKYFYQTNWHIEVGEYFGWASSHTLQDLMRQAGLQPQSALSYTLPFLAQKWQADFVVQNVAGQNVLLPSTQLVVASKALA